MTVVAWKDGVLAADRQGTDGEIRTRVTKLERLPSGEVMVTLGSALLGAALRAWYAAGADIDAFPENLDDAENGASLMVLRADGLWVYDTYPHPLKIEDDVAAFGSGQMVALGAMHAGASAVDAVKIAGKLCISCGMGVQSMRFPAEAEA